MVHLCLDDAEGFRHTEARLHESDLDGFVTFSEVQGMTTPDGGSINNSGPWYGLAVHAQVYIVVDKESNT